MRTNQEIIDFILERIGQMSRRPHMYGGNAEGVDLCYGNYLELWAFATDNASRMHEVTDAAQDAADCGAMGFPHAYRKHHPGASDKAAIKFVVQQWLGIMKELGVPVPWEAIDEDLRDLQGYITEWWATD